MSPTGAIIIGAIAGAIVVLAVDFTEWIRVDDPCGAFAVHGVCGIWGTLSLGLFAVGNYVGGDGDLVKGVFYGGNASQLVAQIKGSVIITVATFAAGFVLMYAVKAIGLLRISEEGELEGIDIHDHGAPAYHPEYAYMGYSPIPSVMEGVAPGIAASAPPSDIHLPTSEGPRDVSGGLGGGTGVVRFPRPLAVFGDPSDPGRARGDPL